MSNCNKNEVHVVVVIDGRPGHEKQSFGIVQALAKKLTVTTTTINISQMGFLAQLQNYIKLLFRSSCSTVSMPVKADLVIGTGTRTHTTVLNIKKYFGVPAVTCMTPGKHLRNKFDICFVPEHDGIFQRHNYFQTYGAPNTNTDKGKHSADRGLIMIGGIDENSHVWDSKEIAEKVFSVVSKEQEIHWTISSSPRTPESMVTLLDEKIHQYDNCTFYEFKDTAKGWVESQYDSCKTVWVTSDSISMLYEALSSGCTVNVFPMSWKKASSKFRKNEDLLIAKGLVTQFSDWQNGDIQPIEPVQLNEAQRCADHILQTCWPRN